MSKQKNTEPLSRRLEAKLRECREALIFLEQAVKTSGAEMPGHEQEILISAIETSNICH